MFRELCEALRALHATTGPGKSRKLQTGRIEDTIVRFTILHILFYTLGLTNSSTTGVPRRRHS
jgi:hypothetical protein